MESRAGIWPLDAAARQRLISAFDRTGVVTVALLKPRAPLEGGTREELEIAVWLHPGRRYLRRTKLALELQDAAELALGTEMVDVLVLNHTSDLLCARVAREGRPILDRSAAEQSLSRRMGRRWEGVVDTWFARPARPPKMAG